MPVLYVDLDPAEEALVLATLDPIGAMAGRAEAYALVPSLHVGYVWYASAHTLDRARPEGFEPPTLWSEATCSSPLSYGRADAKGSAGSETDRTVAR